MTYRDLLKELEKMTEDQLGQDVQVLMPGFIEEEVLPLHAGITLDTVHNLLEGSKFTRSSKDNKYHPEEVILLVDWNLFDKDGTMAFDLFTGEKIKPTGDIGNWE